MISFIVPAHNEQACLGGTLQAIHGSARIVARPYEIIVVDDASTDATAEVARQHNATVLPVSHRQIAATRNSGGRAARGDRLFFVDADTTINPRAVTSALRYMDNGAAGGGAVVSVEGVVPLYVRLISLLPVLLVRLVGFTGGAFMFCTREAFHATGGFNERLYWAEEGPFALSLKREGRFVVLWERVLTSGRRFRTTSGGLQMLTFCVRAVLSPFKMFTQRASVEKIWYDSNREGDDSMPNTPGVRLSNAMGLLILIVLLTGPIWYFIPRSMTPLASPLGKFRFIVGIFLCHVGLVFWPPALVLFWSLLRRKQWVEWLKLAVLCAFCLWQAWESTQGVIRNWTVLCHWLVNFYKG
jgi:glycosyltransferase involved in cell wall biosynthesis